MFRGCCIGCCADCGAGVARQVAQSCLASCLARTFGGIAFATARQLPGKCADMGETSRRMSCRMIRGHCVTVSRDSAEFSASHWRVVKTLRS